MQALPLDSMFAGIIGQDYELLKLICPLAAQMSHVVGMEVAEYAANRKVEIIEIGGGTGITTLAMLSATENLHILSVDNEPTMQNQARKNLARWVQEGALGFSADDALTALNACLADSIDILASAYTLHNFHKDYRQAVIAEIFRVLKPGGKFINGDRYALDDVSAHTRMIQVEVSGYFEVLVRIQRLDLLEHWIVHLFSDESENHVMREGFSLQQLRACGFCDVVLTQRQAVNALVTAVKPR